MEAVRRQAPSPSGRVRVGAVGFDRVLTPHALPLSPSRGEGVSGVSPCGEI